MFKSLGGIGYADWSPDGAKLLSGSLDNTIHIWDADVGTELLTLSGHIANVNQAQWNPDSRRVASASDDGTVRIWDAETGEELAVIQVGSRVFAVAWSPDGSQLAYGGLEGTLTIVSVADIVSATSTTATPSPEQ